MRQKLQASPWDTPAARFRRRARRPRLLDLILPPVAGQVPSVPKSMAGHFYTAAQQIVYSNLDLCLLFHTILPYCDLLGCTLRNNLVLNKTLSSIMSHVTKKFTWGGKNCCIFT